MNITQGEVLDPKHRGQTKRPKFRCGPDQQILSPLGQTKQDKDQPRSGPNRPAADPRQDRADSRPTLGKTEQTKSRTWPDRSDPRPTLGQTEETLVTLGKNYINM